MHLVCTLLIKLALEILHGRWGKTTPKFPLADHMQRPAQVMLANGVLRRTLQLLIKGRQMGGFQTRGGFPIWTCPSFFVLFLGLLRDFPDFSGIFPNCSGMVWGFSRFVLFLFLGLLRAPTRNSPERVCDTIWIFPKKSGKPPGLETPRFSFSQLDCRWIGSIYVHVCCLYAYDLRCGMTTPKIGY